MSRKAGALLWNRMQIVLAAGTTDIDTGITQVNAAFGDGQPSLGVRATSTPAPGALPASRIQVVPLAPTPVWADVTHGEPYFNTTTNTIHVAFTFSGKGGGTINVLFWDPHTLVSPGEAAAYNTPDD